MYCIVPTTDNLTRVCINSQKIFEGLAIPVAFRIRCTKGGINILLDHVNLQRMSWDPPATCTLSSQWQPKGSSSLYSTQFIPYIYIEDYVKLDPALEDYYRIYSVFDTVYNYQNDHYTSRPTS